MHSRHLRQSFLGPESDQQLLNSRACLIGLGGGGSHIAQQLAHLGVGNFVLYDADHVEDTNLNRLIGATNDDVFNKTPKTEVASRLIKAINPTANIVCVPKNWQEEASLVRDAHVVFGCVDAYLQREEIERTCRRFLIPYIDIGMDVTKIENQHVIAGQVILSMPDELCMRCLGFLTEKLLTKEAAQYGAAGGRPQVIWPNGILASAAVGIFVQLITPWHQRHQDWFTSNTTAMRRCCFPAIACNICKRKSASISVARPTSAIHYGPEHSQGLKTITSLRSLCA